MGSDSETTKWFFDALTWWDDATATWDDRGGETVCALFVAALSHHGLPLKLEGGLPSNPAIWRPLGALNPEECVQRIGRLARAWFPSAFSAGATPLPSAPAFQHMFLGLCTLADWIGSDETYFNYHDDPSEEYINTARASAKRAVSLIGLDIEDQPRSTESLPNFGGLFPHVGQIPNAIQRAAAEDDPFDQQLVIIESETGSGKTEAALWRFARMYAAGLVDGIYFALPTRAAATQLHERVNRFVKQLFPAGDSPEAVLAVPGYVKAGDITGSRLQDYVVWWDDHAEGATAQRRWAAESSKRYLAAQIAVGTVDQAMMAALKVRHAHLRAACLARNLLVVDEVHASDTYMGRILQSLLEAHLGSGGYALLMSATLGYSARRLWLSTGRVPQTLDNLSLKEAIDSPYPVISATSPTGERVTAVDENRREKSVRVSSEQVMHNFDAVASLALDAARNGAKVLVIRNTVGYGIGTQQAVEEGAAPGESGLLFEVDGIETLHHGRFSVDDRRLLDRRVEELLGRERPAGGRVVVGTQTLEQSLDIDADLLITDLCPVDVLLQRIGRLHRHARDHRPKEYEAPTCIVLTPESEDLSPLLARAANANGLGPHGFVYDDLRVLEATRRLIAQHGEWVIPKMNRELVERATHPEALEEIVLELGDEWRIHANGLEGGQIADNLTARNAIIRRDKSFFTDNREVIFGDMEERIRTRLGDDRIDVGFEPPPASPFDGSLRIEGLAVSVRWLGGTEVPESVAPEPTDGGFAFAIGDRRFVYDRLERALDDACEWLGELAAHHVRNGPGPDALPDRDFSAGSWQCRSCPFLAVCLPGAAEADDETEMEGEEVSDQEARDAVAAYAEAQESLKEPEKVKRSALDTLKAWMRRQGDSKATLEGRHGQPGPLDSLLGQLPQAQRGARPGRSDRDRHRGRVRVRAGDLDAPTTSAGRGRFPLQGRPRSHSTGRGMAAPHHSGGIEMARTINKVELLGRVGTDPEMQYTPNGTAVTKLRLATDRRRQDGETEADWHSIVCWGKQAEAVNEYVGKGDRIYVAGRLVQNTWEGDDGQRRYRTEIHASEVVFLDSRNGGQDSGDDGQADDASPF